MGSFLLTLSTMQPEIEQRVLSPFIESQDLKM